jgi:hypothetical protein
MGNVFEMAVGSVSDGEMAALLQLAMVNGHKQRAEKVTNAETDDGGQQEFHGFALRGTWPI